MKYINYSLITLFLSIFMLQSCTIEKRAFRKGYHIEWRNSAGIASHKSEVDLTSIPDKLADSKNAELIYKPEQEKINSPQTENTAFESPASKLAAKDSN